MPTDVITGFIVLRPSLDDVHSQTVTGATATTPSDLSRGLPRERGHGASPQLFVALECRRPLAWPSRHMLDGVATVTLGRGERRDVTRRGPRGRAELTVALADVLVSGTHARLFRLAGCRFVLEDCGSKNGTFVNGAPVKRAALLDGDVIEVGRTMLLYRDAAAPLRPDEPDLDGADLGPPAFGLETFVASLGDSLAAVARAAPSTIAITLLGGTGTGKEVVARAAHTLSRRPGPFVALNCGALPATLVEATIFGHRRGAFSGATEDRPGLVRSADHGTLFLDEIGELPRASQVAFLRVLQEREVVPVGDTRPQPVDVRLISATHRSLDDMVRAGDFREDFYARISGLSIRLPPLAERREDLGLLIRSLLGRVAPGGGERLELTTRAARALLRHGFPQNVRELEKALGSAAVLCDGTIDLDHLPEALRSDRGPPASVAADASGSPLGREDRRVREELVGLLAEHHGNVSAVARAMGKGRMQVHRWLKRFGLDLDAYREERG